ncbi:MAG: hypothetical protein JOZ07_14775 [Solirubrobacterales bacterium]|nr:hypothetical protein [Solirubrobacterales bacterium]
MAITPLHGDRLGPPQLRAGRQGAEDRRDRLSGEPRHLGRLGGPAYSLAATLGFIVAVQGVGTSAPAVMLVSFVPMLLIAAAYKYLNRADPDCGTTFA